MVDNQFKIRVPKGGEKNMKYIIQPLNEGQDLNYSEIQDFPSDKHAQIYTREMVRNLTKALPKATISIKYEKA